MFGRFAVIGGDKRQLFLAKAIAKDGFPVVLSYFDQAETGMLPHMPFEEAVSRSDIVILPLPVTRDGFALNTPFSSERVALGDDFATSMKGKRVYGGLMEKLYDTSACYRKIDCYDYYTREELVMGNAMLTAEGAAALAALELPGSLCGSKCLITGFGRIGKALCRYMRAMNADVTCAARKPKDLMAISCIGCKPVRYGDISECYDVIFNTVPSVVLTASQLSKQNSDTIIYELASAPGGVDLEAAARLHIQVIGGQSIPGRVSPKTSGEYIKEAIYNMMEE